MSLFIRAFLGVALSFSAYAESDHHLCHPNENVVFSCEVGTKKVSICASHGATRTTGYVQYRFGTPSNLELVYPSKLEPPSGLFFYSFAPFSGGHGSRIRFKNRNHEYFIFNLMVRTNFTPGEPNYAEFSSGIFTRFKGKSSAVRLCDSYEKIGGPVVEQLDTEDYDYDAAP